MPCCVLLERVLVQGLQRQHSDFLLSGNVFEQKLPLVGARHWLQGEALERRCSPGGGRALFL
jgi:hypothetical protein